MKATLRAIDDYAGRRQQAWPSIQTLAKSVGASPRTIKRAIAGLAAHGVLCIQKRRNESGVVGNRYAIVWSELAIRVERAKRSSATALAQPADQAGRSSTAARDPEEADRRATNRPTEGPNDGERGANLSKRGANLAPAWGQFGPQSPQGSAQELLLLAAADVDCDQDWTEVAAEMRRLGVWSGAARAAVRAAKAHGLHAGDARGAIEHYCSRPGAFAPGALAYWVRTAYPGDPPDQGWPEPRVVVDEAAAQKRRRQQAGEFAQQRQAAERERAETARLERECGPRLDALDAAAVATLAERVLDAGMLAWWRSRPRDGTVRQLLLEALDLEPTP